MVIFTKPYISYRTSCSLIRLTFKAASLVTQEVLKVNLLFSLGWMITSCTCFKPSSNSHLVCLLWNNCHDSSFVSGQLSLGKQVHESSIVIRFLKDSCILLCDMRLHGVNLCKLVDNLRFFSNCISFLLFDLELRFSSLSCHLQHVMGVTLHSYN